MVVSAASMSTAFGLADLRGFDYLSTLSPPPLPENGPVIVAIDEPSMAEIGIQWPWPRSLHAQLTKALRAAGAKAIGFDIIFAEPSASAESDFALAEASGADIVFAGDETLIKTPQAEQWVRTEPLAELLQNGARAGIASVQLGGDGTLRQIPPYQDGFAVQLADIAERAALPASSRAMLQSFGPARTYPTVSYYQALDPTTFLPKDYFRNRVVIIGLSLQNAPTLQAGGADAFATPFTIHTRQLVAGAEIQATIFDNVVNGLFIEPVSSPFSVAAILFAALLAALLVRRSTGWQTAVFGTVGALVFIGASYALLRSSHMFLSPLGPCLAFFCVAAAQTGFDYAEERRGRRDITRAFSSYLSPAMVERLANDPSQLKLGGERRTLTILFCDVRGFTTISEALKDAPEELTTLINRLLTPLSDVVMESGGTIDKYIGDCLMAFWNAPLDDPDHATHAVGAALRMLDAVDVLNGELLHEARADGREPQRLKIGIGINTGDCVVGNMGSSRRFDYSVLGDSVNLASRLEGQSKTYGVPLLLGEQTARLVGKSFTTVELDSIAVKGRNALSPIHTVLDPSPPAVLLAVHRGVIEAKYAGALRADDESLVRLETEIPQLAGYYRMLRSSLEQQ
nr:adenylate/guanylate cyclase domain-containing protein [Rhizobium gei]